MRKKYILLAIILAVVMYMMNLYHKYQQFRIGHEAAYSGSFVVAIAMLEPIANDGYVVAQELLAFIYSYGSKTIPIDYTKALYWCVQAHKPFLASIFGYDIQAVNKSCEIDFAKEALNSSLGNDLSNEYYKVKFISGINWLKIAFETGDKSTINLFKKCKLNILDINIPTNKWELAKLQCICENFDYGDTKHPNCSNIESMNEMLIESK